MDDTTRRLMSTSTSAGLDEMTFTSSGSFVVPPGVDVIHGVAIGNGYSPGYSTSGTSGGGGGGLSWRNRIDVTPGEVLDVTVGSSGVVGIKRESTWLLAANSSSSSTGGASYSLTGQTSYAGGNGGTNGGGGGGAAGYRGNGGSGGAGTYGNGGGSGSSAAASSGGAGGGGGGHYYRGGAGGGGVGLLGIAATGAGGAGGIESTAARGGGAGSNGTAGENSPTDANGAGGGTYGGGAGGVGYNSVGTGGAGGTAAVRLLFRPGLSYPYHATLPRSAGLEHLGTTAQLGSYTVPTHQAGDLLVLWQFYEGSLFQPSLPSGCTNVAVSSNSNSRACRLSYIFATSSSTTFGLLSYTTGLIIAAYRGVAEVGSGALGSGTDGTPTYPALTFTNTSSNMHSWVVGFAGHVNASATLTAPTGMTNRSNQADTDTRISSHDTNGAVSSWSSVGVSAGLSAAWSTGVLEIIPT